MVQPAGLTLIASGAITKCLKPDADHVVLCVDMAQWEGLHTLSPQLQGCGKSVKHLSPLHTYKTVLSFH